MRLLLSILLFSIGLSASASPGQPYFVKDNSTESELPPGIKFWFTAKDLTNGPVMSWMDKIAGTYWWQTNSDYAPIGSSGGAQFNIGTYMESNQFLFATNGVGNTIIPNATTEPFLVVFKYSTFTNPPNVYDNFSRLLIGQNLSGGAMFLQASANPAAKEFGHLYNQIGSTALQISTNTIDLIGAPKTVTPSSWFIMTNGVTALSDTQPWNGLPYITDIGRGYYSGGSMYIYTSATLMEFICWTNATGANIWTSNTIAKVHHYATTNWSFSP